MVEDNNNSDFSTFQNQKTNENNCSSVFKEKEEVDYCRSGKSQKATIIKIEYDDELKPYYVIQLNDGTQRDTIEKFLTKVASSQNQTKEHLLGASEEQQLAKDSSLNTTSLLDQNPNSCNKKNLMVSSSNNFIADNDQIFSLTSTPSLSDTTDSNTATTSINFSFANKQKKEQREDAEISNSEWKEGDTVLYSNDDDSKITREATVVRVDKDSIFGTFFVIRFHDDDTQRIALPKRLHSPGTTLKYIDKEKEQSDREVFLKHFFSDQCNNESYTESETYSSIEHSEKPKHDDGYIPTLCKQEDEISEKHMESAMIAHQKNKQKLSNQIEEVELNKSLTNRERIQAAMRNLGQPVSSTSVPKVCSQSSVESDERSSDMVQRYAVFANLDSDDDITTGEESNVTEHIRNTQHSSSQPYKVSETCGESKKYSLLSWLNKSKHNLLNKNRNTVNSNDQYRTIEVNDNNDNKLDISSTQDEYYDSPMATEIIHSHTRKSKRWRNPKKNKNSKKSKATLVSNMPQQSCRRSSFPYFKSQNKRDNENQLIDTHPIILHENGHQDGEYIPVAAVASNISDISMGQESSRESYAKNRNYISCSDYPSGTSKQRRDSSYYHTRCVIITLAIICAIAVSSLLSLIILKNLGVNSNKQYDENDYESNSLDDETLPMPKMHSESYVQTFYGVALSPMDPTQVTIWEGIMENYASELVTKSTKSKNRYVSASCVINYQIHKGSVTWNRNRKRKHNEKKEAQEPNIPDEHTRRMSRKMLFHEEHIGSQSLTTTQKIPSSKNVDNNYYYGSLNVIKIDFTMTYSTVSTDIDLKDYPFLFLEKMNSKEVKINVMTQLQGRLRMAVEDVGDIYLRDENGASLFFRTFPTTLPTFYPTTLAPTIHPTRSPTISPTLLPTTLAPTIHPTRSPTIRPTLLPTTLAPTILPTRSPTIRPTQHRTTLAPTIYPVQNDCCWFFCLLAC